MNAVISFWNELATLWGSGMTTAIWQSALLALAILGVTACLKRASSSLRFALWMLIPLRLLAAPFPEVPLPISAETIEQTLSIPNTGHFAEALPVAVPIYATDDDIAHTETGMGTTTALAGSNQQVPSIMYPNAWAWMMLIWLLGVLFFMLRSAAAWRRAQHIASHATEITEARIVQAAQQAAGMLQLRVMPRIVVSDKETPPFVMGFTRKQQVVVLPKGLLSSLSDGQILAILAHEFAHIRRRDGIWGLVLSLSEVLYFFHPALYWGKRCALLEREKASDEWVLARSQAQPASYAQAIATAAGCFRSRKQHAYTPVILAESFGELKNRLMSLSTTFNPRAGLSLSAMLVVLLLAVSITPRFTLAQSKNPLKVSALQQDNKHKSLSTINPDGATLTFPTHRSLGTVHVFDPVKPFYFTNFSSAGGPLTYLAQAQGTVVVPPDKGIKLHLNIHTQEDWGILKQLPPDSIYGITFVGTDPVLSPITAASLRTLSTIKGLRELTCTFAYMESSDVVRELAAFTRLERLYAPKEIDDDGLAHISKLNHLTALAVLYPGDINAEGMQQLTEMRRLREFSINTGSYLNNSTLRYIGELSNLRCLSLRGERVDSTTLRYIGELKYLEILNLSKVQCNDTGLKYISQLSSLERLNLYENGRITDDGLAYLKKLPELRMLALNTTHHASLITDDGMIHLTECPNLSYLTLPSSITSQGLRHLEPLQKLEDLVIGGSSGSPMGDEALAAVSVFTRLRHLLISGQHFTDDGVAQLRKLPRLERLNLGIHSDTVTDAGLVHIGAIHNLKHLTISNFTKHSALTTSGLNNLNSLDNLEELWVYGVYKGDKLDLSGLHALEVFAFNQTQQLGDEDLECLTQLPKLRSLGILSGITSVGMRDIAQMKNLDFLCITDSPDLSGTDLHALRGLQNLRTLKLIDIDFDATGIPHIAQLPALSSLTVNPKQSLDQELLNKLAEVVPDTCSINNVPNGRKKRL